MTKIIGKDGYIGSTLNLPDSDFTILLAGHASIKMCENDPKGAWVNNVDFFRSVLDTSDRLIYASTASVYDGVKNPSEDTDEYHLKNYYDLTKRTIDNIALLSGKEIYGLRFATVNGWSPNLRIDVMLNKMVYDALNKGEIVVTNFQLERPILGINDLGRAIKTIIESDPHPGIYNLASFTASVQDMAEYVADLFNAKVTYKESPDKPYAFGINTEKFCKTYNFEFKDTLESVVESLTKPFERLRVVE
jgi:nucleoside-diphosphate-sugar epimerase